MSSFKTVAQLGSTATFYDWFNSYNVSARDKMNSIFISRPYAGDGITLSGNNTDGGYTFSIDGTVNKSMVFNGVVQFNNTVNLSNVELANILIGITGDFISAGVTAGSLVKLTDAGGLTLARANNATSAESIGVAVSVNSTKTLVAVAGRISGTQFTDYLSPGGFSLGCVYFLDPSNAGGITKTEPVTLGNVSKPVLIGSGQHEAIILPYRGQYINDDGISGDAIFNSAFYANIRSLGETLGDFKIGPGTILEGETNVSNSLEYNSFDDGFIFRPAKSSSNIRNILGIVTEIVQFSSVSGQKIILKVNTNGSAISNILSLNNDWAILGANAGLVYLDDSGKPTLEKSDIKLGVISETNFIFNFSSESSGGGGGGGGLPVTESETTKTSNILINGSLSLWQRGRGVTTPYGITTGNSPVKQYLADRWIMWAGNTTGFTASRKDFSNVQTEVSGYPRHFVSLIKSSTPATASSYFYNVLDDVRTIANKPFVFSFYVKTDGPTGQFRVRSIQNISTISGNTYINDTVHATFSANLNWTKKSVIIQGPSANSGITSSYSLIGIDLSENGKTFNFAQFMLQPGTEITDPEFVNIEEEYKKAAKYYQRSYAPDELTGLQYQPQVSGTLNLKGAATASLLTQNGARSVVYLPVKMTKAPTVQLYSLAGSSGDGTVNIASTYYDLKQAGASAINVPCLRFYNIGMSDPLGIAFTYPESIVVSFGQPVCQFDQIHFHYVADADTTIN